MNSNSKTSTAILLCFLQFVEGHVPQICINCHDFNRQSANNCTEKIAQCGDCLTGFLKDEKDPRFCYEIENVKKGGGGEVVGVEGQSIDLPCEFNAEVDCFWEKNGHKVQVDDSIRFRPSDVDDWRCCTNNVKSESIKVQIAKPLKLLTQPKPLVEVSLGEAVLLPCVFNHPVQCDWSFKSKITRNVETMKLNGNYEYTDGAIGLKVDCSLRIREMAVEEEGEWRCKGLYPHTKLTEESSAITLTANHRKMSSENVIIITLNDVIKNGKKIRYEALMSEYEPLICEVSEVAKTMEWVLLGKTVKRETKINSLTLSGPEVKKALHDWSSANLQCVATYEDESTMTSHVTVINTEMKNASGEAEVKKDKRINLLETLLPVIVILLVLFLAVGLLMLFTFVFVYQHKKSNNSDQSKV